MSDELRYCLALNNIVGVGPVRLTDWLEKAKSFEAIFKADPPTLASYGMPAKVIEALQAPAWEQVDKELAWQDASDLNHIISIYDAKYPVLLKQVSAAPIILYIRGNLEVLSEPQLAMVGSRNPTARGAETAFEFARCLAQEGLVITSGLALGIDGASHRGALAGSGKTIGVIGTGVDLIYPSRHKSLVQEIVAHGGAIVSEFPLGTKALSVHFPRRNRIISGLSLGTLVVEAALESGSLITAKYALEQNREVFSIPGSIHSPLARGCHTLLREGAKLVETAQDILEELGALANIKQRLSAQASVSQLEPEYQALLNHIDYATTPIDVMIKRSGMSAAEVASMVLILELQGHVEADAGGYIRR